MLRNKKKNNSILKWQCEKLPSMRISVIVSSKVVANSAACKYGKLKLKNVEDFFCKELASIFFCKQLTIYDVYFSFPSISYYHTVK